MEQYDFEQAKLEYRELCKKEKTIPLFAQDWYLDAVCESIEDWKVILVKKKDKIIAAFPFQYMKSSKGFWYISNPFMAARLGIWIDYDNLTLPNEIELYENKIVNEIINTLPKYDVFHIVFDTSYNNWQAFYRNGFSQTTYYTYVLKNDEIITNYMGTLKSSKKWRLTKAEKLYHIEYGRSGKEYYDFFSETYLKRDRVSQYSKKTFLELHNAVSKHNAGRIYYAKNTNGDICASQYLFYDSQRVYAMFCAFDPLAKYQPNTLLTWNLIQDTKQMGLDFDFEGSMIPGVADFCSSFNAKKVPHYVISNYSNRFFIYMNLSKSYSMINESVTNKLKLSKIKVRAMFDKIVAFKLSCKVPIKKLLNMRKMRCFKK